MELEFVAAAHRKEDEEAFEHLGALLGTNWSKDKVRAIFSGKDTVNNLDKWIIPLAYLIRPEIKDMLKPSVTVGGEKLDLGIDEEYVDLMSIPKEDFLKMVNRGQ